MQDTKRWFESFTLWFNGVLAVLAGLLVNPDLADTILSVVALFGGDVPKETILAFITVAVTVVNILLRFKTNQAIRVK